MNNKAIKSLLLIGLIGCFTIGTSFIINIHHAFWGPKNIWWTSPAMKLPIEKTNNYFELFIGGKNLQKHLSEKTLIAVDENGIKYPVVSKDISVRLNNWYKIKSDILTRVIFSGIAFGVAIILLIIGLMQIIIQKKKTC